MAGSEASEDCVLAATTCAGTMPGTNVRNGVRANISTTGYSSSVIVTYIVICKPMYQPSALITLEPARAHTDSTSANTPSGAAHSTQRTITIMVSAMAWKNS